MVRTFSAVTWLCLRAPRRIVRRFSLLYPKYIGRKWKCVGW